jgi:SNF2 family DNA or RNA helicase
MNDALGRRVKVKDDVVNMYNNIGSEKLEKLKRIVQERSKVVVYSQYNTVLEHYSKHIRSSIITGKSSRSQRKKNIEKFIHGETQVFFLSTKVADVGINLTEGDTLVFLEPGIDPEVRTQAIGRLQRIGQERIQVHKKEYHEAILNIMSSDGSKSSKSKAKKRFLLRYIVKILNLN